MAEHREPSDLEERLAIALDKLGTALKLRVREDADRHGLSPTQLQILAHTRANGGSTTPSDLVMAQGVGIGTISDSLSALETKGLITRERGAQDGRRVVVRLTARGIQLSRKRETVDDPLIGVAQSLNPAEQTVLLGTIMKAIVGLQNEKQVWTTAMCVNCTYFHAHVYRDVHKPHHCGYVDAPFGDTSLQVDCADFESAPDSVRDRNLNRFMKRRSG